uniref:Uncharacterized protein n=1 Tax=Tanacetum cinerariifolium TaxID=118510 RepID=A0A699HH23_TANCI|nr:hypothetical protein [Tanacetum cinerariifolium]
MVMGQCGEWCRTVLVSGGGGWKQENGVSVSAGKEERPSMVLCAIAKLVPGIITFISGQFRVNLTTPTLTFPGIEAHAPFSIMDKPSTGLIYLNNKKEKRVMCLAEIVKFCDATLERILKEVKLKIFKSES